MKNVVAIIGFFLYFQLIAQDYFKLQIEPISTHDFSDIAPWYYKDGYLYTSNKKTKAIETKKTTENQYFYDVFFHGKDKEIKLLVDSMLSYINTPFHDGPACTFGDTFFVSQNFYIKGGKKHKAPVGIFIYDFSKGFPPIIKPFPYNNKYFRVGHPSITKDGQYLFFASDMPGGYGGFDIYVSQKNDTTWSAPINLGKNINSEADEIYPFIVNNRLYFASNRDALKQYDIYYSENEDNTWSLAKALPEPFNSNANDFGFICDSTYEKGYLTSNRNKTDDIYFFYSTLPLFEQCDSMIENYLCFHFVDENMSQVDTLPVIYEWHFGDNTKVQAKETDHCYKNYGIYHIKLLMIDTISNEIQEVASYELNAERAIQPYITFSDTLRTNIPVIFDASESYLPGHQIKQYVWIFSDGYKATGITCTRIFKKSGVYSVRLGIVAINEQQQEIKRCSIKDFEVY